MGERGWYFGKKWDDMRKPVFNFTSTNSDYAKCSEDLFELQLKYDGLLPKETIERVLKKHFA